MRVRPVTPDQVEGTSESVPDVVIECFNRVIISHMRNGVSKFTQGEIVGLIMDTTQAESSDEIFKKRWLDVEDIYRRVGWEVTYDGPGYNESYEATFEFKRKWIGSPV